MSASFLEGASVGLLLSAMVGPVFFSLIQSSLNNGFRYASVLAFGIFCSDTFYVIITYFGIKFLAEATYFEEVLGYVGGLILIGFGLSTLIRKNVSRPNSGGIDLPRLKRRSAFFKGFSINGINPFVLLFWISIASLVQTKESYSDLDIIFYYSGILITVFAIDLIKAFVAKQISHLITDQIMFWMNKAVGVLLIGFGIRMLVITLLK